MDICEAMMERNRHDSEKSCSSTLEYNDLEAAEALVCMSSWVQRTHKPRPLTPTSDSCDSLPLQPELNESSKDLVSLSSLVSDSFFKKRKKNKRKEKRFGGAAEVKAVMA